MHAIALFNSLNLEGRRVAVGLISREPMSRDDASLYTHGGARSTSVDRRLAQALARDSAAVVAASAAAPLMIAGQQYGGTDVLSTSTLRRSMRSTGSRSYQEEHTAPQLKSSALNAPLASPAAKDSVAGYGVDVSAVKTPTVVDAERAALAEERRRVAQRPETGEDFLDAMAQKSQRRSSTDRKKS